MSTYEIGGRLLEIMGTRGLTQAALAEAVGASPGAVSSWVSGRKRPTLENMQAVARVLEIPLAALLEGADVPRNEAAERAAYQSVMEWYWRPAPSDEGRELGNAAAFAFEPEHPHFGSRNRTEHSRRAAVGRNGVARLLGYRASR